MDPMSNGIFCHAYVEEYYNFYTDPDIFPGPTSMPSTAAEDEIFGILETRDGLKDSDHNPFTVHQMRMVYEFMREPLESFHAFANDKRLLPWEMEKWIGGWSSRVDALFINSRRGDRLHLDMYDWKFSSNTGDHAETIDRGRENLRIYRTVCEEECEIIIDNTWIVVFDPNGYFCVHVE